MLSNFYAKNILVKIDQGLLKKQYQNPSNLDARRSFNERFAINKVNWYRWLFDHFNFPKNSKILELGCGLGSLWSDNQDRIPQAWDITLSDMFQPMLEKTRVNLAKMNHPFYFQVIDIQKIPYPDNTFDAVIANHLLYLVPDIKKAVSEVARVLNPEGVFLASTSGSNYMKELEDLLIESQLPVHKEYTSYPFSLENGKDWLSPYFSQIELFKSQGGLLVTEAEPLAEYILSTNKGLDENQKQAVYDFFKDYFTKHHQLKITKETGLFIARKT